MVNEMMIYEIGTGYTPIPAQISAATEIVVAELTRAMRKQGREVQIIDIWADDRAETDLPIIQVPVMKAFSRTDVALGIMHKLKRVAYSVSLAGTLKRILKEAKEKVVFHFHNQYNLYFFLMLTPEALRRKCLIAYTNHSGIWRLDWKEIEGTIKNRYFQEAKCMERADVVFVLNEETKNNVIRYLGVAQQRIIVIGNGVNTDVYSPLSEEKKTAAKEKYGLGGKTVVLQVGSVYENKGQLRSVQYLEPMMKGDPDLVFVFAGGVVDEEYLTAIQDFARERGIEEQVRYLGMVKPGEDLNQLYNTAAATILPSRYEGFSLVSIESCAAGVPVCVDELGPIRIGAGSVVYNSKHFEADVGVVIDPEDPKKYEKLCACARENAVKNYSWQKIAADFLNSFAERL